jgi:1,4-dihydroxy-6-naphthoate synthase
LREPVNWGAIVAGPAAVRRAIVAQRTAAAGVLYHRPMSRIPLTLAHSPDPDDAFMWWPLTGMVTPAGEPLPGPEGRPAIDTGTFEFRSLPLDIEALNRRAIESGGRGQGLDITALSVRTWADVQDRYVITACGASFGDGFGPKLVARVESELHGESCVRQRSAGLRIAIPGRKTTAFLMLGLVLRAGPRQGGAPEFLEMPFDQIIPAVALGRADAGLVIHEGQLAFANAGLRLVIDVGAWWKQRTGLKLALGINAVRRDLEQRHGPGTLRELGGLLRRAVAHAMEHWDRSVSYTMPFAEANARRSGAELPTLERIDRYCRMYVSENTRDMGDEGREAIRRLLSEGAAAGLCPEVLKVETI